MLGRGSFPSQVKKFYVPPVNQSTLSGIGTTTFHAAGSGGQTASAASFGITCAITTGDSVVVFGSWGSASTTTPTVVTTGGTGSDAFTLVYGPFTSGLFKYGAWLLPSAGAGRTGATVSWASSNPSFADGWCESFSGLSSPVLDGNAFATGSGTALSSGNTATLTTADQFAVAYGATVGSGVTSTNSPWTDDGQFAGTGSRVGHQVLTATTAISSNFTAGSAAWISFALTFKAGGVSVNADLSATEADDTLAGAATLPVTATATVTEGSDSLTADGTVPSQGINATLSITETNDSLTASGAAAVAAVLSAAEANDSVSASASSPASASYRSLRPMIRCRRPQRTLCSGLWLLLKPTMS